MRVLMTGGSGLLGREVQKLRPDWEYPTHSDRPVEFYGHVQWHSVPPDVIVHAAAVTSPPVADSYPVRAMDVNICGTANIVRQCAMNRIYLIYISTDYVFPGDDGPYWPESDLNPINKYAWSKLGGECAVRMYHRGLIVRGSFGAVPFPYDKAFVDQWTTRVPVNEFAKRLVEIVDRRPIPTGVLHIAGPRRTVYEYAKHVSPDKEIGELRRRDVSFKVPFDTTLTGDG